MSNLSTRIRNVGPGALVAAAFIGALLSMGFTDEEAQLALAGYTGSDDLQEIVRYALKRLGGA